VTDQRRPGGTQPGHQRAVGACRAGIGEQSSELNIDKVKRVIACSGKVYYDLVKTRVEKKAEVAIVRVEQLYPFPHKAFAAELKKYPNATDVVWCQDEPQNQGAWFFVQHYIHENMSEGQRLGYAGRAPSSSPARATRSTRAPTSWRTARLAAASSARPPSSPMPGSARKAIIFSVMRHIGRTRR